MNKYIFTSITAFVLMLTSCNSHNATNASADNTPDTASSQYSAAPAANPDPAVSNHHHSDTVSKSDSSKGRNKNGAGTKGVGDTIIPF